MDMGMAFTSAPQASHCELAVKAAVQSVTVQGFPRRISVAGFRGGFPRPRDESNGHARPDLKSWLLLARNNEGIGG